MPLDRIPFQQTTRPLNDTFLFRPAAGQELDFDPPYQRGSVWSEDQRRELVRSLMQGLPVGVVFINTRNMSEPARVVDGKQRLQTIISFYNDEFTVPADWFTDGIHNPDGFFAAEAVGKTDIVWSDLTDHGKHRFYRNSIAVYETRLPTEAEEADLYLRINFGGAPQTDADRDRAEDAR